MSPEYQFWADAWAYGWASESDERQAVALGLITPTEFTQITQKPY